MFFFYKFYVSSTKKYFTAYLDLVCATALDILTVQSLNLS